ncbi:MAG: hypothetical protein OEW16_12175 [Gammaproteobacteria bacterium]|nr:hypothetical protein [Gammaproteobacteria bacterium]
MLFLDRQDVIALLPIADCITAVERAFAAHATGELPITPAVLGAHVRRWLDAICGTLLIRLGVRPAMERQ